MKTDLRFPRSERLKSRKSIDALFQKGKRLSMGDFRFIYQWRSATGIQVGVGTSSRQFKRAVDRNRIKRLIRESYRLDQHGWKESLQQKQQGLDLFILFVGRQLPDFSACQQSVHQAREKIFSA
jgi:ribonuclease P protein component